MSDNKIADFDEKKIIHENLFSIPIVQYQTTNTDEMNKELKEIILKKEKEIPTTTKSNQGGWQSEGDFFRWGGESIENLYNLFLKLIESSTKKLEFVETIPMDFHIYGWANVNRKGHSNIAHIHPMSTWSGTYYVDAGDELNPNLSHLTAFFPGLLPGEYHIKPKTGLMNLFPSYVRHGVRTYHGNNPRICVAVNAAMRIKAP